jgi:hypothetical protein
LPGLKSVRQASRLETREELRLQLESEGSLEAKFPLLWATSFIFVVRPSTNLIRFTHNIEGSLLYSKTTDNVNLKIAFSATSGLMASQVSQYSGLVKLTDKINQ